METARLKDRSPKPLQACAAALMEVSYRCVRRGDFHLSITEPSPGEPAISSAMEILQPLFDGGER